VLTLNLAAWAFNSFESSIEYAKQQIEELKKYYDQQILSCIEMQFSQTVRRN
jgi:hypothetical protein